jgi:hypothetical protein
MYIWELFMVWCQCILPSLAWGRIMSSDTKLQWNYLSLPDPQQT